MAYHSSVKLLSCNELEHSKMHPQSTREAWLGAAAASLAPDIATLTGHTLPPVRVSCSFPHARGTAHLGVGRVIGECWPPQLTADGIAQIMITPLDANPTATLATLAHELIHAAVGCQHGHDAIFSRAVRAIGLIGKPTATVAGPDFALWADGFVRAVGTYPHAPLRIGDGDTEQPRDPSLPRMPAPRPPDSPRKQDARMMRAACGTCGYLCRVSRMWLARAGAPLCPTCGVAMRSDWSGDAN